MSEINISDQLKNNKELSSNVKSLFRLLVLIIKTLVNRVPKKRTPKNKEKSKEEEVPPKELLGATQERTMLEELEEENERLKVEQEKEYCSACQQVVTAKSGLALPKSDIGLNLTILICYLWVLLGIPFTRLAKYLKDFFLFDISTSHLNICASSRSAFQQQLCRIPDTHWDFQTDDIWWK